MQSWGFGWGNTNNLEMGVGWVSTKHNLISLNQSLFATLSSPVCHHWWLTKQTLLLPFASQSFLLSKVISAVTDGAPCRRHTLLSLALILIMPTRSSLKSTSLFLLQLWRGSKNWKVYNYATILGKTTKGNTPALIFCQNDDFRRAVMSPLFCVFNPTWW